MSAQDRLFGMAMRAAATLAPFVRAAAMATAAPGGSSVWRPVERPRREMAAAVTDVPARRVAVRGAVPHDPHPAIGPLRSPIPQAGEGDGRDRARPAPSIPLPRAAEGDAQRRVRDAALPPAPRRPVPPPSVQVAPAPRPAPVPVPEVAPRPASPRIETPPASVPRAPAVAPPAGAAAPTPWTPPPDTPPEPVPEPAPPPLDESRLARWLSGHLAAETRRPARGGTGFDPRLSPPWPGTLQGPWGWGG